MAIMGCGLVLLAFYECASIRIPRQMQNTRRHAIAQIEERVDKQQQETK
jgi:hypothetical protein